MEKSVALREMRNPRQGMREEPAVWFGRRPTDVQVAPVKEAEPPPAPKLPPSAAIVELRTLCLGEMDPTSLAKLTPEELTQEVERTLAEIATQKRIQLNGREQRALARCRTRGPCLPANRRPRRAPHRREHADGGRKVEGRFPRQHCVSAAGAR